MERKLVGDVSHCCSKSTAVIAILNKKTNKTIRKILYSSNIDPESENSLIELPNALLDFHKAYYIPVVSSVMKYFLKGYFAKRQFMQSCCAASLSFIWSCVSSHRNIYPTFALLHFFLWVGVKHQAVSGLKA